MYINACKSISLQLGCVTELGKPVYGMGKEMGNIETGGMNEL